MVLVPTDSRVLHTSSATPLPWVPSFPFHWSAVGWQMAVFSDLKYYRLYPITQKPGYSDAKSTAPQLCVVSSQHSLWCMAHPEASGWSFRSDEVSIRAQYCSPFLVFLFWGGPARSWQLCNCFRSGCFHRGSHDSEPCINLSLSFSCGLIPHILCYRLS